MTDGLTRFLKKGFGGLNLGQIWANLVLVFCYFLKFGSSVFLEIACSDSLQQCVTSSRGKIYIKSFWGPKFVQRGPKAGPKLGFCSMAQLSNGLVVKALDFQSMGLIFKTTG